MFGLLSFDFVLCYHSLPPLCWYRLITDRSLFRPFAVARHPRGSYMVLPIAASGVATPENEVAHWRCHP